MGDIKTKLKYYIRSNEITCSLLNLYFAIRKGGIKNIKTMINNEIYNHHCRKPWYVDKDELKRQKASQVKYDIKVAFIVDCKDGLSNEILRTLDSISNQTMENWLVCCVNCSEENKEKIDQYTLNNKVNGLFYVGNIFIDFIEKNNISYIGKLMAGDVLHPFFMYRMIEEADKSQSEIIYCDDNSFEKNIKKADTPRYKPDFSVDTLYSYNYIGRSYIMSTDIYKKAGSGDISGMDVFLYAIENNLKVSHISDILYYEDKEVRKRISIDDLLRNENVSLQRHFEKMNVNASIEKTTFKEVRHIKYDINDNPLVSIIIPNKDHIEDLSRCINSIINKSSYKNYEIIVVENNSTEKETFEYYEKIKRENKAKVCIWEDEFNYSAINNFGKDFSNGEYIVLLNNDIEVISENWIEEMLMYAQRDRTGAVGCMLYYPDDTVQHAGVIVGIGGIAGHSHKHFKRGEKGYCDRMAAVQNMSAVTAACMMTSRKCFEEAGGLDEKLKVAFNDIDYCMKLRKAGYDVIFTPFAEMYHYESISRGYEDTSEKEARFRSEVNYFMDKWGDVIRRGDPYYNPHLTLRYEDFSLK
ncbi:MAG: glycosyltransferase family 2 protein [Lachnospiraceae bacterium]|nr:glycosyltransferase family 2 protein [Lachnospiraceae bacterium]